MDYNLMIKLILRLIIISVFSIITFSSKSATPINLPEAIIYEPVSNTYFISNVGSNSILRMDTNGNISDFYSKNLVGINGLFSLGDTLFATVKHDIVLISIANETLITVIPIPGSGFLESVTSDYKGKLYITDSGSGHIYDIDLATRTVRLIYDNLNGPQGIIYDFISKRMVFIEENTNSIYQLNIEDNTKTLILRGHSLMDGLTQDNCGNFYVSSWETKSVYVYNNDFKNVPTLIASGNGPADISIDLVHNLLLLPELAGNSIKMVSLYNECTTIDLVDPMNGAIDLDTVVNLTWEAIEGAGSYQIQYSLYPNFNLNKIVDTSINGGFLHNLKYDTIYYWRVRTLQGPGKSNFGEVYSFRTRKTATSKTESILKDYKVYLSENILKIRGLPESSEFKISIYSIMSEFMLNYDYDKNKDRYLTGFKPGVYIVVIRDDENKNFSCNKIIF